MTGDEFGSWFIPKNWDGRGGGLSWSGDVDCWCCLCGFAVSFGTSASARLRHSVLSAAIISSSSIDVCGGASMCRLPSLFIATCSATAW